MCLPHASTLPSLGTTPPYPHSPPPNATRGAYPVTSLQPSTTPATSGDCEPSARQRRALAPSGGGPVGCVPPRHARRSGAGEPGGVPGSPRCCSRGTPRGPRVRRSDCDKHFTRHNTDGVDGSDAGRRCRRWEWHRALITWHAQRNLRDGGSGGGRDHLLVATDVRLRACPDDDLVWSGSCSEHGPWCPTVSDPKRHWLKTLGVSVDLTVHGVYDDIFLFNQLKVGVLDLVVAAFGVDYPVFSDHTDVICGISMTLAHVRIDIVFKLILS